MTCGISNNLDGIEDALIRDSMPRQLDVEEDDSDIEVHFQGLDEGDADGIVLIRDPEGKKTANQ